MQRLKPCFIVDIDGTVADCEHRRHYLEGTPKNWDAFFSACRFDIPFDHMRTLVSLLQVTGVVWVSGRPERCRKDTYYWLYRHGFINANGGEPLYMRADGDFRADDIVKAELLQEVLADGWKPIMAFDDRDRVVKMWRANGVPCAQVAEGNF